MGPVRLAVGVEWLVDGRTWRVVRQLAPDRFIAQDAQFLVEQEFSAATILLQYTLARVGASCSIQIPVAIDFRARRCSFTIHDDAEGGGLDGSGPAFG